MSANGKGAYNRSCSGFMHREGKTEGFYEKIGCEMVQVL